MHLKPKRKMKKRLNNVVLKESSELYTTNMLDNESFNTGLFRSDIKKPRLFTKMLHT